MRNNRRDFLKKGALTGLIISGTGLSNTQLLAQKSLREKLKESPISADLFYRSIHFNQDEARGLLPLNAIKIFYRILKERTGIEFNKPSKNRLTIRLVINPGSLPEEGFQIDRTAEHLITITSSNENGILYGLGKLLHNSTSTEQGFKPGKWEGLSAPEKKQRNIYFATHFNNFYHTAPIQKVINYIEELAFWGYNTIEVWFDMHGFEGINDPKAKKMLERLALILRAGKSAGMKVAICMLANEGYNSTPIHLRATEPKQIKLRGRYGVEICPSKPGGIELIMQQVEEEFDAFKNLGVTLDFLILWPYDQGGCGCDQCIPWGSNGYLNLSRKISTLARRKIPSIKIVLSTWLFDCVEDEGEWRGLTKTFQNEKPFVDYIQADSHEKFPKYLNENRVPGGLPLLNFPEISMWNSWPWGGFGANPLPQRFQLLWNEVKGRVSGGAPYSEGIFEDLNKVIYSQFYWTGDRTATDILREYLSFEFSPADPELILEAIEILEKNHGLQAHYNAASGTMIKVPKNDFGAKRAYEILQKANDQLPYQIKTGWRWRILFLRAMFDYELRVSQGVQTEKIKAGFLELTALYYADQADPSVHPPRD